MGLVERAVTEACKIDGWMKSAELAWLARAASSCDTVVEVGSWKGRSTKALAKTSKGVVYAVDHWKGSSQPEDATASQAEREGADAIYRTFASNLAREISERHVVPIRAESGEAVVALQRKIRFCDMLFIDADHGYESVKRDIKLWSPLVRSGGLLCGHDYHPTWPGVVKAVDEMVPSRSLMMGGTIWFQYK